jgi:hypothetical protein
MKRSVAMNIRLTSEEYAALKARARSEGRSLAQVVREAIRNHVEGTPSGRRPGPSDPLLEVIGIVESGVRDGAEEHDHYIYGTPRRKKRSRA